MIGLSDFSEMMRLTHNGGNVLYATAGCMALVLMTVSSVCLKAALKTRRLNKRSEKVVEMQEIIVDSLKQTAATAAPREKPEPKTDPKSLSSTRGL